MAYTKTNWINGVTPISADNLNNIENGIEENENDITENVNVINNLKGTVLWTNPKPTNEFAAQDVTLNSGDYEILEIWFRTALSDGYVKATKCYKGIGTMLDYVMPANARVGGRAVGYTDDTTLGFVDAYYNGTVNNTACIPLYIIGYKTGLFD